MENQKKLDGTNKLIAEFMGYRYQKSNFFSVMEFYKNNEDKFVECKYHKSWDWLMPVVDKIESFTDDLNQCRYNVEIEQCFVCITDNHNSEDIIELDADKKIDAVYQAVVEFIKFYNENK